MYKKFPSRDSFKQQQVHDKKQNIIELPNFWRHYNCKGFRPHNNKNIIVSTTIEKELSFDYFLSNNNNNNLQQVSELGLIHYTMANQQTTEEFRTHGKLKKNLLETFEGGFEYWDGKSLNL